MANDPLTLKTGLNAEQRKERSSNAGKAAHTVSNYVARIVRGAPDLTPDDIEALRRIVGPVTAHDAYLAGLKDGSKMAVERIAQLAAEVG